MANEAIVGSMGAPVARPPADNLTPAQASEFLQVPEGTLAVWRSTKRVALPFFKLGGHVRYRRTDLLQFISQNMRGAS